MDFVFLLGRFHVLALHLPIGIILAVVVLETLARKEKYGHLNDAAPFLWAAAAITSIVTVALGYMHFAEGGFDGPSGAAHRLYGTCVAVAACVFWWLRTNMADAYRRVQLIGAAIIIVLITVTGHYGGNLTHGSTYLWEYAPQPLRSLMGLGARRPPVTDLALADPYLDVVGPMLEARCASCHGPDQRNGEFEMSTYELTLAGGETGTAIVPGNASVSELYRRITLSEDHDAFMPAEGRTPLTAGQVAIIGWWIDAGAPRDTTLGVLGEPAHLSAALAVQVGLSAEPAGEAAADPALVSRLNAAGFLVRQVSLSDPGLIVSVYSRAGAVTRAQAEEVLAAAGEIVELDLGSAGLGDGILEGIEAMTRLTRLNLRNNDLSDSSVARLRNLSALESLNLYGNARVTDAALDALAGMESLRRVYLWQTSVTSEAIARLRESRPGLEVQAETVADFGSDAAAAVELVEQ